MKDKHLLFVNNNNQDYGSLNEKQERSRSLNADKLISNLQTNDCDTKIRRLNEYSYIISVDHSQQETDFHSAKSTLADIHTDLVRDTENLLTGQGFIHIKEYALDRYKCRCDEHNDDEIDNEKYSFNYKLKF
jgi:hypothetical protein